MTVTTKRERVDTSLIVDNHPDEERPSGASRHLQTLVVFN